MSKKTPKSIRIILAQQISDLFLHEKEWDLLSETCPSVYPTQTFTWTHSFFKHKLNKKTLWVCLFAYYDDKMIGVFPLVEVKRKQLAGISFQFFSTPSDPFHTIRTGCLVLPGHEYIMELFLKKIKDEFRTFPIIRIANIPECSSSLECVKANSSRISFIKTNSGQEVYLKIKNSFQEYLDSLNPKFRREIKRQERRLIEQNPITYRISERKQSNQANLDLFVQVESSGWKGEKRTSVKENPGDLELFSEATDSFHKKGMIKWSFLQSDSGVISAQIAVKVNTTVFLWKIGYREEFAFYAPGNLLLNKFIEHCHSNSEIEEINFMSGRSWLKPWSPYKRELYNLVIFPKHFLIAKVLKIFYKVKNR